MQAGLGTGVDIGPDTRDGAGRPPFVAPSAEDLAPYFPQLEILELLGRGGMGAVYKARQKQLDRFVAVKILPPGSGDDPAFAERFTREAKALAKLNHPSIVTLYEFGQTDGLFYFIMEFVDGLNLRQLLEAGRIAPREALAIVPQICDALQYAHDAGIVHRDIKPENILLDRRGRVKVADFGLAKIVSPSGTGILPVQSDAMLDTGEPASPRLRRPGTPVPLDFTEVGKVMGTPPYMAPEQTQHPSEVDHRADIYSLGVVFYQMLTGELPSGQAFAPPSSRMRGLVVDVRLDEVVLRALEKEPDRRYQQASILKTRLETIATTPSLPAEAASNRGPGVSPVPFPSNATNPAPTRRGRLALILCLLGIIVPALFFLLAPGPSPTWILLVIVLGFTSTCELAAFVLGILGWKSGTGKAAAIVAALLPLLAVPGSYLAWMMVSHRSADQWRMPCAGIPGVRLAGAVGLRANAGISRGDRPMNTR